MQTEDPLSRRLNYKDGVELNNAEKVLLKLEFFAISAIDTFHKSVFNNSKILREIKIALLSDNIMKDYKSLLNLESREFSKFLQNWNFENSLLLYREKIYISKSENDTLRQQIMHAHYNLPSVDHLGY